MHCKYVKKLNSKWWRPICRYAYSFFSASRLYSIEVYVLVFLISSPSICQAGHLNRVRALPSNKKCRQHRKNQHRAHLYERESRRRENQNVRNKRTQYTLLYISYSIILILFSLHYFDRLRRWRLFWGAKNITLQVKVNASENTKRASLSYVSNTNDDDAFEPPNNQIKK